MREVCFIALTHTSVLTTQDIFFFEGGNRGKQQFKLESLGSLCLGISIALFSWLPTLSCLLVEKHLP